VKEPHVEMPPPDRGRLLDPETVARGVFNGTVSRAWIVRNVRGAGSGRVKLSHRKVAFWENDVRQWLEERGES
jgi:hypothetical protein